MKLKGIDFGSCFLASGSLNFFGNGWYYDKLYSWTIPGFKKVIETTTFVAKTTTLNPRPGNMPLKDNFQPRELKPKCIKVYPFQGVALNSVGLSGPGLRTLIRKGGWFSIRRPFFISFMAMGNELRDRMDQTHQFVKIFGSELSEFRAPIGLQINVSCPNTGHNIQEITKEAKDILKIASVLNLPLDLKINVFMNTSTVREIEDTGLCDILTLSNTIPFGTQNTGIDWSKFGKDGLSPLQNIGGGGLSGRAILPCVLRRIEQLRGDGITLPIKGSGGIMSADDVDKMKHAGVNGIEIGTVLMLRPWQAPKIIQRAKELFD